MSSSPAWTPPRSAISQNFGGLLDRLAGTHGLQSLDGDAFQVFLAAPGDGIVLLLDEPDKTPESWDLAVIFPDLLKAAGKPRAAVLRPEHGCAVMPKFGINRLPALLFLRDGGYVGSIQGLRDWNALVAETQALMQSPVSRAPGVGIAVTVAGSPGCH